MARFVSHLNPVGGWVHLRPTFSARFDRGLAVYKKNHDAKFDTTVIWGNEFNENNNSLVSHPSRGQVTEQYRLYNNCNPHVAMKIDLQGI